MKDFDLIRDESVREGFYEENTNYLGTLCWTYFSGKVDKGGYKLLSVFCPTCHKDVMTKDLNDRGLFTQKRYSFKKKVRCGCSKNRAKVLQSFGIDAFINHSKVTKQGNTLTIHSVNRVVNSIKVYNVICSVCSLDTELYPLGSFTSEASNFSRENFNPCGCGNKENLSIEQKEIKVQRMVKNDTNLEFGGFTESSKAKGKNCYLKLRCLLHNHYWESTCFDNFRLRYVREGKSGCTYCGIESIREKGRCISNGVYKGKEHMEDYLYLLKVTIGGKCYTKIGRSFDPHKRVKGLSNDMKRCYPPDKQINVEILKCYKESHLNVTNLEKRLHKTLKIYKDTPEIRFPGYSEFFVYDDIVLDFYEKILKI